MASSTAVTFRIKRFDGSNYLAWKNRVYTELQCEDLTSFVTNKPTADLQKKTYGTEKKPLTWAQADARARRVIVEHLDDCVLHYAPPDASAYEIWRKLRVTYCRTSYLQHAYLRRKLANLQFDGRSSLTQFLRDFDEVIAEIRAGGGKVGHFDDIEAVVTLLAALPTEFTPVIASLGDINENSPVTLEALKGVLLDYDLKRRDESKPKKFSEAPDRAAAAYVSDASKEAAFASDSRTGNTKRNEAKSDTLHCSYCDRDGHSALRCFKRRRDRKGGVDSKAPSEANLGEGAPRSVAFLVENEGAKPADLKSSSVDQIAFVADSGCTRFMVGKREHLKTCIKLDKPVTITLADNRCTEATHTGTIEMMSNRGWKIIFTEVLLVPGLRRNLLSVKRVVQKGFDVTFGDKSVVISKGREIVAEGSVENDLFFLKFDILPSAEANLGEGNLSYHQLHRRLGHVGSDTLLNMRRQQLVEFQGNPSAVCEACVHGKLCQLPYPKSPFKTSRALEQVVSDVCEATTTSFDGFKYFLTFLDVHTHFSVVYLLRHKHEVFGRFMEYEAMVRAHFGYGIGSFLCDNGREFINQEVMDLCRKKGIRLINSVAYNHQQNGRAERLNRTLEDRSRTLLMDSGLPKNFWSEAVLCSNFCLNRCMTKATGKVPAVEWYRQEISYHKLCPFGCVCYVHIPKEKRRKFDARATKGIMVGYAPMAYRIYDLSSKKVIIARNVRFDETAFFNNLSSSLPVGQPVVSESSDDEPDVAEQPTENVVNQDSSPSHPDVAEVPRRGSRERHLPTHLEDYEVTIGYAEALLMEDPTDSKWDAAKQVEMELMRKYEVWDLVPRQPGMKVLRSKWALQEKPEKLKARLVAVGCDERDAPSELFSPVVNMTSVKIFLSVVVQRSWKLHQMDVSSAFLHGNLTYDVFMEQAPGFRNDPTLVCKLKRAIYGLKVSPKIWNQCINEFLVSELHFGRSRNDFCLYSKTNEKSSIFVLIYVDDLLIASDSSQLINDFKVKISSRFNVIDLGESKRFLGMELCYDQISNVMTLSQARFIDKVAMKFKVTSCKVIYTPIEVDLNLSRSEATNVKSPFRQLLGCLLYISIISRPDIAFSVNYFSRFMNAFSEEHFLYLKRVLVYLLHTKDKKLTYVKSEESGVLDCYVDADWGSDRLDRKSVSGSVIKVHGNVVMWSSKKQSSVSLSSTESEYVSLSTFVHDSMTWVLEILKDFQITVNLPVIIYEDNQSVICLSENPLTSKRSKHIDVRFRFLKEMVQEGRIKLKYIPTCSQLADGFTKGLVKAKFMLFRDSLRVL